MKKYLKYVAVMVLFVAQFSANTPSQLGAFQLKAPEKLKK